MARRRIAAATTCVVTATASLWIVATPAGRSAPAATSPHAVASPAVRYSGPVTPLVVLRGFDPPGRAYGPGHLGVDLRSRVGGQVRVAADGTVSFAGQVAGRGVVVVLHADGIRTEYEPVRTVVRRGERVRGGQVIGYLDGTHRGCAGTCLHWGARVGEDYLDPLSLLRPLGVVRLLPWGSEP